MTTYVFGAGASNHAGYPLTRNLGTALRDWIYLNKPSGHDYRNHIDRLQDLYKGLEDLESILTDLDECLPSSRAATLPSHIRPYLLPSVRDSIREYFNDLRQNPSPYYAQLARERIQPGDVIITFNYDMACERELKRAGLWEISDGYGFSIPLNITLPFSRVKVLKLHGSTNWFAQRFGGSTHGFRQVSDVFGARPLAYFQPDFEYLGYPSELRDTLASASKASGFPAMIMPTLYKEFRLQTPFDPEWEPFWDTLWQLAADALKSSMEIVIVGYSMPIADERARSMLLGANLEAHLTICCGDDSKRVRQDLEAKGFEATRIALPGSGFFTDYLTRNPQCLK